jgi:hypothetical protein
MKLDRQAKGTSVRRCIGGMSLWTMTRWCPCPAREEPRCDENHRHHFILLRNLREDPSYTLGEGLTHAATRGNWRCGLPES